MPFPNEARVGRLACPALFRHKLRRPHESKIAFPDDAAPNLQDGPLGDRAYELVARRAGPRRRPCYCQGPGGGGLCNQWSRSSSFHDQDTPPRQSCP